jgi:hypothetical protein
VAFNALNAYIRKRETERDFPQSTDGRLTAHRVHSGEASSHSLHDDSSSDTPPSNSLSLLPSHARDTATICAVHTPSANAAKKSTKASSETHKLSDDNEIASDSVCPGGWHISHRSGSSDHGIADVADSWQLRSPCSDLPSWAASPVSQEALQVNFGNGVGL